MNIKIFSLLALSLLFGRNDISASDLVYGPYEVGFKSFKTYDLSRPYLLGEDTIPRPLLIHLWYPSQEKLGQSLDFKHYIDLIAQREDYNKSISEIDTNSYYYVKAYSDFAKSQFGLDASIQTQQILDAPVKAMSGLVIPAGSSEFPLIIYAPSNSKASVQNHLICEYLASQGFIILSVASAGPNSIRRENVVESTMAQVMDMEYILQYCRDSLGLSYTSLGLFGFSTGTLANTIFQMRNNDVAAVLSMDGSMEYSFYLLVSKMEEFKLEKANIPYCSLINNYENFSIYPMYNSVHSRDKFMIRMPYLDHNGFISYWRFFDSCAENPVPSQVGLSYDYMSECAWRFFRRYLKPETSPEGENILDGLDHLYIEEVSCNYSAALTVCNTLLDNNLDSASRLVDLYSTLLFQEGNQLNILARMFNDEDIAIWLYQKSIEYQPDSWEAHYGLGFNYKEKGELVLAKKELLNAKKLNPDNREITNLLDELTRIE